MQAEDISLIYILNEICNSKAEMLGFAVFKLNKLFELFCPWRFLQISEVETNLLFFKHKASGPISREDSKINIRFYNQYELSP